MACWNTDSVRGIVRNVVNFSMSYFLCARQFYATLPSWHISAYQWRYIGTLLYCDFISIHVYYIHIYIYILLHIFVLYILLYIYIISVDFIHVIVFTSLNCWISCQITIILLDLQYTRLTVNGHEQRRALDYRLTFHCESKCVILLRLWYKCHVPDTSIVRPVNTGNWVGGGT